jgi:hypothetical protein
VVNLIITILIIYFEENRPELTISSHKNQQCQELSEDQNFTSYVPSGSQQTTSLHPTEGARGRTRGSQIRTACEKTLSETETEASAGSRSVS